jgi:hypothetical protein
MDQVSRRLSGVGHDAGVGLLPGIRTDEEE